MCAELFGLSQTPTGMELRLSAEPLRSTAGEAAFWTGHAVLCAPGALLIGYGISPFLGRALRALKLWLDAAGISRQLTMVLVPCVLLGVAVLRAQVAPAVACALLAALCVLAVGIATRRLLGPAPSAVAAVIVAASPLGACLSITSAQFLSRAFVAVAIVTWLGARAQGRVWRWAATGLAIGVAMIGSPVSAALLLLPLVLDALWTRSSRRDAAVGLVAGLALPLAVLVALQLGVFGATLVPDGPALAAPSTAAMLWTRFGSSCVHEALALAAWFVGPLGLALVVLGATTDRVTRLLSAGLLIHLASGLFIGTRGPHLVGPIASADCLGPLAILAAHGIARVLRAATRLGVDRSVAGSVLVVGLLLPSLAFDFVVMRARSAEAHDKEQSTEPYRQIRGPRRAMVRPSPKTGSASGKSERQQAPKRKKPTGQAA